MAHNSIVLQAVGDIALGDHPLCAGFGTHSRCKTRAPHFPFEHVEKLFKRAEILFGNLECTLSESGLRRNDYHSIQMRGHPRYLDGLRTAGFHVLNLANNHSLQHGPVPFNDTVSMLRQAGILACGVGSADYRTCTPEFLTKNGMTVAFLGYSLRPRQYFAHAPLYAEGYRTHILQDVRAARAMSDSVVVSLHWGDEFIDRPSPEEIDLAHAIIDSGAQLIIGHHPHVLRGVERYGRGYIVYSLGNFVCDMLWDETLRETAILECRLTPDGITDLDLIPVKINDDCQPVPLEGAKARALSERIAQLSHRLQRWSSDAEFCETMDQYQQAAQDAHRKSRAKSHRYFVRHAHRFPPRIVAQQLLTYVKNRLAERGLVRQSGSTRSC